ncbi:MAG TPA: TonB-dependent receptor, partial [Terriglobales bacterium]
DSFGGAIVPQASDIFAPGRDPSRANLLFRGEFGRSFSFSWGAATSDEQRQFNLVSTASRLIGNHQLKVGVDYRRMFPLIGGGGSGLFEVVSVSSIFGDDIVNGQLLEYEIANGDPVSRVPIFSSLSAFIQDTWHPSTRLTLTYGGRFERVPPPTETTGRLPRVVLGIDNDVLKNLRLAPPGTKLWRGRFGEFAPRVGGAYQLITRAGRETTIRGGVGVMYDLDWGSIANAFGTSYPFVADKSLCCELSFPLSAAIRTPPVLGVDPPGRLTVVDPNLRQPYTIQWNTTVEQSLGSAQVVSGSYVGSTGRRLIESQFYPSQSLADFPNVRTSLNITRSIGLSSYKALQIQYRRRLQRGLQALGSYTLAQSRDTASFVNSITPATRVGGVLDNEFAPSDFDVRHVFSAAVTYDVPKLSAPTFARKVLRDWGLDLLVRYQSAIPVNPTASSVLASDGTFYISRPDLVPGQPLYVDDPTVPGGRRFNNAAFKRPAAGTQGNFPRNGLRGFPASQIDLALRRQFAFGENVRLQLRGELFNVFNHPNFGPVNTSITSPLFGQPTQMLNRSLGGLNALYQMGGPRSGQLAVKVVW